MQPLIEATQNFVRQTLCGAEGGHDWLHTQRVWTNARAIAAGEQCDSLVVELAALLHDIADSKFHNGDEELGPRVASEFLQSQKVERQIVDHVRQIVRHVSFKGGLLNSGQSSHAGQASQQFSSIELQIVQDADRLDAIGAIGIARAFSYGGFKHRLLYDPAVPPNLNMTREQYKQSTAPTINHFYEKLLLLSERMHTATARQLAQPRHDFMLKFLDQFYSEVQGKSAQPE